MVESHLKLGHVGHNRIECIDLAIKFHVKY